MLCLPVVPSLNYDFPRIHSIYLFAICSLFLKVTPLRISSSIGTVSVLLFPVSYMRLAVIIKHDKYVN